jgi:hypothetical protein
LLHQESDRIDTALVGLRRDIGKFRDKTKFSENQNPKPHHEGAHARPRDAYLLEMHVCKIHACEVHTYKSIRP